MSSSSTAPTLVLVPAAFTPPEIYEQFTSALKEEGLHSVVVSLPSVGNHKENSAKGMLDDADEIARVAQDQLDNHGAQDVVLVTHSYGGVPASESMKTISRKKRGDKGGVSTIIYVASIVLPVGLCNDEMRKRPPPPTATFIGDWIISDHAAEAENDYNDLSPEEGKYWASRMQDQSVLAFRDRATYAGYNDADVHYISCTKDAVLPKEAEGRILGIIRDSSGREPKVHKLDAGHTPHLSKPKELAAIVKKIVTL